MTPVEGCDLPNITVGSYQDQYNIKRLRLGSVGASARGDGATEYNKSRRIVTFSLFQLNLDAPFYQ